MANPTPTHATSSTRRAFIGQTAAAATAFTFLPRSVLGGEKTVAPNSKTTIAGIGVGGQGMQNLESLMRCSEAQIVAVCDVNRESAGYLSWNWSQGKETQLGGREPARRMVEKFYAEQKGVGSYRGCKVYSDYREMLAKEDIDAVMIATPDHSHAVITMEALRRRKHVYCEKPLTYSVYEARKVAEAARAAGVATQMGNMGQATEEARLMQEYVAAGAIGAIREVQVQCSARFWRFPGWETRPPAMPVPEGLDWDMWLGPAPERNFHPDYHPWVWRNWWDFGTGQLGDLGCHKMSAVFKALKLGHPDSVEACSTKLNSETYPLGVIVRYHFPARGDMPPVTLNWYDGGLKPLRPAGTGPDDPAWPSGDVLLFGEKGILAGHRLLPSTLQKSFGRPPKILPRSPGHYKEWVDACRGGPPAGANFVDHAGQLSEVCLLGNVAVRAQKRLLWDGPNLKITNNEAANKLLHREYRSGWSL